MARLHREDFWVYAKWLRDIIERHCGYYGSLSLEISHHRRFRGREIDLLVVCVKVEETGVGVIEGKRRTIIVELKENDFRAVLEQALERRNLADYVYAAVNLPIADILNWMASQKSLAEEVLSAGVGVVSIRDDAVVFKAFSRQKLDWAAVRSKILTIMDYIPVEAGNRGG